MQEDTDPKRQAYLMNMRAAGIPPAYIDRSGIPKFEDPAGMALHQALVAKPQKLAESGKVVYIHSAQEDQALLALSEIGKAAALAKVKVRLTDFPQLMTDIKLFDASTLASKLMKLDLIGIYLIGSEYVSESGFTEAAIDGLLRKRKTLGKTTLLCSHLTPVRFSARYKLNLSDYGTVVLECVDGTSASLMRELTREIMG